LGFAACPFQKGFCDGVAVFLLSNIVHGLLILKNEEGNIREHQSPL
jgi:hypothetical protein